MSKIAVVGAGAKAAALAARAAVLRQAGVGGVPDIIIFESEHIGAAWSGNGRFSSGFLTLCTPGEKDVGFPYNETEALWSSKIQVAPELFARFSWASYLVANGLLSDWVDRGRDHPSHRSWSDYLIWVIKRAGQFTDAKKGRDKRQQIIFAKVTKVRRVRDEWEISFIKDGVVDTLTVDGVVLTGTGRSKTIPCAVGMPADRVFDSEDFWAARERVLTLKEGAIAVAGDGGAAGTIVAWLAERFAERLVSVVSINPMGTLFPRGDGHAERRWFSDPSDWPMLSVDHRRKLLERTEAGVISMRNKRVIDSSPNVAYERGKALEARWDGSEITLEVEYEDQPAPSVQVNYLIAAIGFDSWSLLELVDHPAVAPLCAPGGSLLRRQVEAEIEADLTLPTISGLPPGLHMPSLAGLAHGPGMGNLGCLGLMAAAILRRYLTDN